MQAKVTPLASGGGIEGAREVSPLDGLPMEATVGSRVGSRGGASGIDWRATYASLASMEGLGLLFEVCIWVFLRYFSLVYASLARVEWLGPLFEMFI